MFESCRAHHEKAPQIRGFHLLGSDECHRCDAYWSRSAPRLNRGEHLSEQLRGYGSCDRLAAHRCSSERCREAATVEADQARAEDSTRCGQARARPVHRDHACESGAIPTPLTATGGIDASTATSVTTALSFSSAPTSLTRHSASPRLNVSPISGGSAVMRNSDSPVGNLTDTI